MPIHSSLALQIFPLYFLKHKMVQAIHLAVNKISVWFTINGYGDTRFKMSWVCLIRDQNTVALVVFTKVVQGGCRGTRLRRSVTVTRQWQRLLRWRLWASQQTIHGCMAITQIDVLKNIMSNQDMKYFIECKI